MTEHYLSRLQKRFANGVANRNMPDFLTRHNGGHDRTNQVYISGYFQVILGLPVELYGSSNDAMIASQWFHTTCESFTPHTLSNTKIDVQGQGQVGTSYVANTTVGREFTLAFREYQNLPILTAVERWLGVFDPYTGVSPLAGNRFIPTNYKGWCLVVQTKPVGSIDATLSGDAIEAAYFYPGVFPTNLPIDALNSDQTANDSAQLSVTFSFDGYPVTTSVPGFTNKCVDLLSGMKYIGTGDLGESTYNNLINSMNIVEQFGSVPNAGVSSGASYDSVYGGSSLF